MKHLKSIYNFLKEGKDSDLDISNNSDFLNRNKTIPKFYKEINGLLKPYAVVDFNTIDEFPPFDNQDMDFKFRMQIAKFSNRSFENLEIGLQKTVNTLILESNPLIINQIVRNIELFQLNEGVWDIIKDFAKNKLKSIGSFFKELFTEQPIDLYNRIDNYDQSDSKKVLSREFRIYKNTIQAEYIKQMMLNYETNSWNIITRPIIQLKTLKTIVVNYSEKAIESVIDMVKSILNTVNKNASSELFVKYLYKFSEISAFNDALDFMKDRYDIREMYNEYVIYSNKLIFQLKQIEKTIS